MTIGKRHITRPSVPAGWIVLPRSITEGIYNKISVIDYVFTFIDEYKSARRARVLYIRSLHPRPVRYSTSQRIKQHRVSTHSSLHRETPHSLNSFCSARRPGRVRGTG